MNDNPSILEGLVRRPDVAPAAAQLDGTYIIRVFAEFETALQHFLRAFHVRKPKGTEALINRVRDRGRIPQPQMDLVQGVRDYRNMLVHERTRPATPVTIREATSRLCTFLSRVQRMW